jgi:hypothetical protein
MAKPNESHTEEEQERIDAVNRYQRVNAPPKFAKALVDRGYGCESGSGDTIISIKAVRGSGSGMNQRATEECSQKDGFGDGTTRGERTEVALWREKPKIQSIVALEPMRYDSGCMNSVTQKMRPQAWQQSNVLSKRTVWWFKRGNDTSDANPRSDTRC